MTYFNQRARFEALRSLAFGSIAAGYANVGTATSNPARIVICQNTTDAGVIVSFDGGVTDHVAVAAGGGFVLDFTSDSVAMSPLQLPQGSQIAVKRESGAPTSGAFYVSVIYGSNQ